MNFAAHDPSRKSSPLAALEHVLDGSTRDAILRDALSILDPRGADYQWSRKDRLHLRSAGGFVVEVTLVGRAASEHQIFIEIPADSFEERKAEITRRFEKQRHRLGKEVNAGRCFFSDERHGLFVRLRGVDDMIDGLAAIGNRELISAELPGNPAIADVALLAHRLNRRAILKLRDEDGTHHIVKLYKKGSHKPQAAFETTSLLEKTSFGEDSAVQVPLHTSHLKSWPGCVMDLAAGTQLSHITGETARLGMALAGTALGQLHRLPLRLQKSHTLADEFALLQAWSELVAHIHPSWAKAIRLAMRDVSAALLAGTSAATTLVHRDFHGGQILVAGERATLIDFDTVCNGEPAQDIGNFLAHLDLARLEGTELPSDADAAFQAAYAHSHQAPQLSRVVAHRNATLLRIACIHAFSDRHQAIWTRLLDLSFGSQQ
jgi:Ser/Thr protein kinase RdoA (MazF antagonist)